MTDRLWSVADIVQFTGLSRSTVYERIICRPDFPKKIRLARSPLWPSSEDKKWILRQRD